MRATTIGLLCSIPCLASAATAQFQTLLLPGETPNKTVSVAAISADGRVVVGSVIDGLERWAYRWTPEGGREDIGRDVETPSLGYGVSDDGNVVVGYAPGPDIVHGLPFRWTRDTSFVTIPVPVGADAAATGASADGSAMVGWSRPEGANVEYGFYWTQAGGVQILEHPEMGPWCTIQGVSSDGTTVVGDHWYHGPFRWTAAGGVQYLDPVDGISDMSLGMNRDASIIVGSLPDRSGVMWTADGTVNLGMLAGTTTFRATDVNDAGTVVVGYSEVGTPASRFIATIWTAERGLETLTDFLTARGITVPSQYDLLSCNAISADGRVIGGASNDRAFRNSRIGFVVDVGASCAADFNGDGMLDFFDYLGFVEAFEAGDARGDFNGDGFLDFFDYSDFVAEFESGC